MTQGHWVRRPAPPVQRLLARLLARPVPEVEVFVPCPYAPGQRFTDGHFIIELQTVQDVPDQPRPWQGTYRVVGFPEQDPLHWLGDDFGHIHACLPLIGPLRPLL